jgi:hypothetical protein
MGDISNKTLGAIVGLALVVSLVGLFSINNGGLSGLVTYGTTGQARINISELAALNVTHNVIDFGNGTLESSVNNCTLTSERPSNPDPFNCWTGTGATSGGFTVVNVGNVALNVTVKAVKNGSMTSGAKSFFGTTGSRYMWRCAVGSPNGTNKLAAYTSVRNASTSCVTRLNTTAGSDAFALHLNITIPSTATGRKNDTITFTGIKA